MTTKIVQQDAIEFLSDLADQSVDLIISSPPYCMGKEYDTSCTVADFAAIHEKIVPELVRVLRDSGNLCWQIGNHVRNGVLTPLDAIVYAVFAKQDSLRLRNRIVWTFGHGEHCRRRFSGRHETVLWFSKGDDYAFALDAVRVPQKYPGKRHHRGPKAGQPSCNPKGKNPGDVWDIPNVKSNHVEKTDHPCQFPVALAQRLVKALSPKRGLVVDPYLGSGSTAVAALLEGRLFMGCDVEEKYIQIANGRVEDFHADRLKVRPLDRPVHVPGANDAVAKIPPEWKRRNQRVAAK